MATVPVEPTDKCDEFLSKFYNASDCLGSCRLCVDPGTGAYVPCPGQGDVCGTCKCHGISPSLVRLLKLKGVKLPATTTVPCSPSKSMVPEPVILEFIEALLLLKLVAKVAIGLGVLSAMLIAAVVYLLLR